MIRNYTFTCTVKAVNSDYQHKASGHLSFDYETTGQYTSGYKVHKAIKERLKVNHWMPKAYTLSEIKLMNRVEI